MGCVFIPKEGQGETRVAATPSSVKRLIDAGFTVVGVSPQSPSSHDRFKERYDLPFTLLFDKGKKVIRQFGVDGLLGFGVRRATFVIEPDKKIKGRVVSELSVGNHTDFIREAIAKVS